MAEALSGLILVRKDGSKDFNSIMLLLIEGAGPGAPKRKGGGAILLGRLASTLSPKLKRFYEKIVEKEKKQFEVIFLSKDEEADDLEYYDEHQGNWCFIKFGDPAIKRLLEKYNVKVIPALRVIKGDGSVAVEDARGQVVGKGADEPLVLFKEWQKASQ